MTLDEFVTPMLQNHKFIENLDIRGNPIYILANKPICLQTLLIEGLSDPCLRMNSVEKEKFEKDLVAWKN